MRVKIILVIALLSVLIFWFERKHQQSVLEEKVKIREDSLMQDSLAKIVIAIPDDLINYIDASGKRQGKWEFSGAMLKDSANHVLGGISEASLKNYAFSPSEIVKKGNYIDGMEDGEWIFYNPDGTVKEKRNYKAGKIVN